MPKQLIVLFPTSENSEVLSLSEVLEVERRDILPLQSCEKPAAG